MTSGDLTRSCVFFALSGRLTVLQAVAGRHYEADFNLASRPSYLRRVSSIIGKQRLPGVKAMLAPFLINLLMVCGLLMLAGWTVDFINGIRPTRLASDVRPHPSRTARIPVTVRQAG